VKRALIVTGRITLLIIMLLVLLVLVAFNDRKYSE
jgi:hypothetical protein